MNKGDSYYFAPMEGITDVIYRNAHRHWFYPADKYFTAFLVPDQGRKLSDKVLSEVLPQKNSGICLVPQILTNRAEDFLNLAAKLWELGYREMNINLGCPSKTVTTKRKGAGFLAFPEVLHAFLEQIFACPWIASGQVKISVKTRLGVSDPEEFKTLLEIYNEYPLHELIIHPRVQKEYYQGEVHWNMFTIASKESRNPLCYNGNLFTREDFTAVKSRFPLTNAWMAGRGILKNPGLFGEVNAKECAGPVQLRGFHDEIYRNYRQTIHTEKAQLSRMKEFWSALGGEDCIFLDPLGKKEAVHIFRTRNLEEYDVIVKKLLDRS